MVSWAVLSLVSAALTVVSTAPAVRAAAMVGMAEAGENEAKSYEQ